MPFLWLMLGGVGVRRHPVELQKVVYMDYTWWDMYFISIGHCWNHTSMCLMQCRLCQSQCSESIIRWSASSCTKAKEVYPLFLEEIIQCSFSQWFFGQLKIVFSSVSKWSLVSITFIGLGNYKIRVAFGRLIPGKLLSENFIFYVWLLSDWSYHLLCV